MIEFKENQTKIFFGKHKAENSQFINGWLDFHLVYSADQRSGYGDNKFVRVITFENIYPFDELKSITSNNFEDEIPNIKYIENGGYVFDKKTF